MDTATLAHVAAQLNEFESVDALRRERTVVALAPDTLAARVKDLGDDWSVFKLARTRAGNYCAWVVKFSVS